MVKGARSSQVSAGGAIKSLLWRCFAPLPPLVQEGSCPHDRCSPASAKLPPPCTVELPTATEVQQVADGQLLQPAAPAPVKPVELLLFPAGPGSLSVKVAIVPVAEAGPCSAEGSSPSCTSAEGLLSSTQSSINSPGRSDCLSHLGSSHCHSSARLQETGTEGSCMPDSSMPSTPDAGLGAPGQSAEGTAVLLDTGSTAGSCHTTSGTSVAGMAASFTTSTHAEVAAPVTAEATEAKQQQQGQLQHIAAIQAPAPVVATPADLPPTPKETAVAAPVLFWLEDLMTNCQQLAGVLSTLSEAYFKVRSRHPDVELLHLTRPADRNLALSSPWMTKYAPTCHLAHPVLMVVSGWTGTGDARSSARAQPLADMLQAHMADVWVQVQPVAETANLLTASSPQPNVTPRAAAVGPRSGNLDARLVLPDLAQLLLGNPLVAATKAVGNVNSQLSDVISWWNAHYADLSRQPLLQLASIIEATTTQLDVTKEKLQACFKDMQTVELSLKRQLMYKPVPITRSVKRSMLCRSHTMA